MMAHWDMLGTALAMAGLGAALGGIGGLLGIGGGLLAIPVLALLFGMEQAMAQGTALVMIVPNVLLAFYRYRQQHAISLRLALGLGALAMLLRIRRRGWRWRWITSPCNGCSLPSCWACAAI